jgi:TRAP-type C4-dicarboxylate transport system permease small subunit
MERKKEERKKLENSPAMRKDQKSPGKVYRVLSQIPERILLIILIVTMLDMVLSVFTRYVTGKAIYWAEEVGIFGLVWMTMIGTGIAVKKGVHFAMPTFVGRFPPGVRYAIALANHALITAFGVLMLLTGAHMTIASSNMFSPALEVNLGILNSSAIACGVLIVVYEVQRGIGTLRRGSAPSPGGH